MNLFVRRTPPADLYDLVSEAGAALVIHEYSSSFGLASRLLAEPVRTQVRNVYALVRVADEIVDTPTPPSARSPATRCSTWLQDDVRHAMQSGYSANLVVHAFARTAAAVGIDRSWSRRSSTRCGRTSTPRTPREPRRYIYGSAEVVGLMCLRAFVAAPEDRGPARGLRPSSHPGRADSARPSRRSTSCATSARTRRPRTRYFPGLDVDDL